MLKHGACRFHPQCPVACSEFKPSGIVGSREAQKCYRCTHRKAFHEEVGDAATSTAPFQTARGYTIGWPIGKGEYGEVFDAVQPGTGARVAIKRMDRKHIEEDERRRKYLEKEIKNMQKLSHPNIMRLIECFVDGHYVYMVLERVQGTELFEKVASPKLRLTLAVAAGAGGASRYTPAFADELRRAIAAFLKVSPERVNLPITTSGAAEVRAEIYPPPDLSEESADAATQWSHKVGFLRALERVIAGEGLRIDARFGATLLSHRTETNSALDEGTARRYFRQILKAVDYMHKNGVCHRDLKLENVMADPTTGRLKLIDFGFSRSLNSALVSYVGTQHYMAPELFSEQQYRGEDVDVWALGVLLFVLLVGNYPFGSSGGVVLRVNPAYDVAAVFQGTSLSAGARRLLLRIFVANPAARIQLDEIMRDEWVAAGAADDPAELAPPPPAGPEFQWPEAEAGPAAGAALASAPSWAPDDEELYDEMAD